MNDQKRLFLLDAYALIFRGYYAFIKNPRINSKGMDTSAILGFTNSHLMLLKESALIILQYVSIKVDLKAEQIFLKNTKLIVMKLLKLLV